MKRKNEVINDVDQAYNSIVESLKGYYITVLEDGNWGKYGKAISALYEKAKNSGIVCQKALAKLLSLSGEELKKQTLISSDMIDGNYGIRTSAHGHKDTKKAYDDIMKIKELGKDAVERYLIGLKETQPETYVVIVHRLQAEKNIDEMFDTINNVLRASEIGV